MTQCLSTRAGRAWAPAGFPRLRPWALALVLLAGVGLARPQDVNIPTLPLPTTELPNPANVDLTLPAVSDNYQIGPDDLLSIFIASMPDSTGQVRVASDGTIDLPLLADPLPAAGKSAHLVAQEIATALVRQQLAVDPVVRVVVRQVLSRPIVVAGAVKTPMVLQASRPVSLLEALARAGGLSDTAGTRVLLSQPGADGTVTRTIDIETLTQTVDPKQNPLLYGNDVVRVLPARRVFVVGAFLKPGAFPEQAGQPITVLDAIALAEGFNPNQPINKKHGEIIRTRDGVPQTIPVNVEAVLRHQVPDPVLQAGDVFYVPVNTGHQVWMTALGDATQMLILGVGYNAARIF